MCDSQNFIYNKYREKILRYSIYRDSGFETIKGHSHCAPYGAARRRTAQHGAVLRRTAPYGRRAINSSTIFRTIFGGSQVATGYGACVYIIYDYRAIFVPTPGGLIGTNPYGGCAEIVRKSCNFSALQSLRSFRKLSMEIVRSPCGFRAEAVRRYGDGSLDA